MLGTPARTVWVDVVMDSTRHPEFLSNAGREEGCKVNSKTAWAIKKTPL